MGRTIEDIRRIQEERGIEFYFAQFVDMYARPSAKLIPAANLDDLVADVSRAGLAVRLKVDPQPAGVPRGIEVSAYRIIQEALTNTLKHSGSRRASVRVRFATDAVEVDVEVPAHLAAEVEHDARVAAAERLAQRQDKETTK